MSVRVSLKNAVQNVQSLMVPPISDIMMEAACPLISSDSPMKINDLPNLKYNQQMEDTNELREIVKQGQEYINMLYTYRGHSEFLLGDERYVDAEDKSESYSNTINSMSDGISKLYDLMAFARNSSNDLCDRISKICSLRKEFICQNYLLNLGYLMSILTSLDELKNIKSSVKNDFSTYRRALQCIGEDDGSNSLENSQRLSIFLATSNIIRNMISDRLLRDVRGYDEVLCDIANVALDHYHKRYYLTSKKKYDLVRMVGFCVSILDIDNRLNKLDSKKKLLISQIDKMFEQVPIVPLCQDTQSNPYISFVNAKKSESTNPGKWPGSVNRRKPYIELEKFKNDYARLMMQLSKWNTALANSPSSMDCSMVIECLFCLSEWQSYILELHSWNLSNPISNESLKNEDVYDRAIKFNLSNEDKSIFVHVIWMIKSLQSALHDRSLVIEEASERFIAHKLKIFLDRDVNEMLTKLSKKRKEFTRSVLTVVQDILLDTQKSTESFVCLSQIDLLQMIVQSMISDKPINGRKTLKRDLDITAVDKLYTFYRDSILWPYLLNFKETLIECCELSPLWFREWYLEVMNHSKNQYTLESSLPWLLTDYLLDSSEYATNELIFFPLSIYDDAARVALFNFKKQYLYDEIENEIEAFMSKLTFKLASKIFAYYKQLSGCLLLDKRFRFDCESSGVNINFPVYKRCEHLLCKQQITVLGRSIKFGQMLRSHLKDKLVHSIQLVLLLFESKSLIYLVELKMALDQNRILLELMSSDAKMELFGGYDSVLHKASSLKGQSFSNRISSYIINQAINFLIPSYCFDSVEYTFIPSNVEDERVDDFVDIYGTLELSVAFKIYLEETKLNLKCVHFQCLYLLVGYKGLTCIVQELRKVIHNIINKYLNPLLDKIKSILPQSIDLEYIGHEMDPNDLLSHFVVVLRQLIRSKFLPDVFLTLSKLGNALAFCKLLEIALGQEEISDLIFASRFRPGEMNKVGPIQLYQELRKSISRPRFDMDFVHDSDLLSSERLCLGLSFYAKLLTTLNLHKHGFADMWAALVFVSACKQKSERTSDSWHQTRIHGIIWAGQAILYSLGEQHRYNRFDICQRICLRARVHPSKRSQALNEFVERASVIKSYLLQSMGSLEKIAVELGVKNCALISNAISKRYIPPPTHPFVAEEE